MEVSIKVDIEEYALQHERKALDFAFRPFNRKEKLIELSVLAGGAFCMVSEGRFKIFIDEDMKNFLTPDEYIALIKHEEGHCATGKFDVDGRAIAINENEEDADAYAVSEGCKPSAMKSALLKALKRAVEEIFPQQKAWQRVISSVVFWIALLQPRFVRRMVALRRLEHA